MEQGTLDIKPTDDGYILSRTTSDGVQSMPLSNMEVMTLAQSAVSLQAGVLARLQPSGTGATAVITATLEKFRVTTDSLEESVLLEMRTPNGGQVIYTIVPTIAQMLAQELVSTVSGMGQNRLPS